MIRLIRQRAHVGDAHIEYVFGIARMVGQTAPDFRALLDQRDAKVGG
jgi:hypothetical protein